MKRKIQYLALGLLAACGGGGGSENDAFDMTEVPDGIDAADRVEAPDDGDVRDITPDAQDLEAEEPGPPQPSVSFTAPEDGAVVANPVLFEIAAVNVDEVEIFADETYSLGPAWDPAGRTTLLYRFSGTGFARSLHVTGRVAGEDAARDDLVITVEPDSCEDRFFVTEFDARNEDPTGLLDMTAIREDSLAAVKEAVAELQACGAGVTLGGMMSLLLYEGGFRVAAYNTRCEENSYNPMPSGCDADPEALYSYQFGLGAIHTSNFHPCKGGSYTQGMRASFIEACLAAGFAAGDDLVTPDTAARFHEVCPDDTPSAVDYYLLGAHDVFHIPRDDAGNFLEAFGVFPLFTPRVSIALTLGELASSCGSIDDDRDAIRIFGGGDSSYADPAKQNLILSYYENFAAENCG
jgi:hypothetical protein